MIYSIFIIISRVYCLGLGVCFYHPCVSHKFSYNYDYCIIILLAWNDDYFVLVYIIVFVI